MGNKVKIQLFLDYASTEFVDDEIAKYAADGIELNRSQAVNMIVGKAKIQSSLDTIKRSK